MNNSPLVSIITVVYNGEKTIGQNMDSVLAQSYENIEHIIIDGDSTDKTVKIIDGYGEKISSFISEPDEGIYDAMNKGLRLAQGKFICILNADDYYLPRAIELSMKKIKETQSDYSFANVKYVDSNSMICPIYPLEENLIYQEMPYPHVSAVISKNIYDEVGFFDTNFKIAGDHDMAVRIHLNNYKYCYVNEVIAELEMGGISSSNESNKESLSVAIKNGKSRMGAYGTYYKQLIKVYIVKLLPKKMVKTLLKVKGSRFQ